MIERLAYKDIWAGGIDSFLDMLYPRLQLMKRLLAENGSIYVHIDWHVGHYVKLIMDEIFGWENLVNELVWAYAQVFKTPEKSYRRGHETLLFYSKSSERAFNIQYQPLKDSNQFTHVDEEGKKYRWKGDKKFYLPEQGAAINTVWEIPALKGNSAEFVHFPTQKPEKLLERIIKASSNEGDLIADFFAGSGTTLAVAEKLNRRWIGCDFSKVAIQIARNRLVNMNAKPFLLENIGNYQRQMIYLHGGRIYEMQRIVLKLYGATLRKDFQDMGVREAEDGITELVYVSYPDRPVTAKKVEELAEIAERLDGTGYRRLVILGWDYEYNYEELRNQRKRASQKARTVEIVSKMIPPEVYDYLKKAKTEEELEPLGDKIFFHEKPYLRLASPEIAYSGNKAVITLGIQRYVLFDIPIEKEKERAEVAEIAKSNFAALIDYWAVDWDYDGMAFKAMSQAFRGFGKRAKTVPIKMKKELEIGKEYTAAVRVIDIFGNDATATAETDLRKNKS